MHPHQLSYKIPHTAGDFRSTRYRQQSMEDTWSHNSDLLFSINKCIHLSFNNKIPTSYSVATTTLPHVQLHSYRDLGLLLSDDFSWRNHYDHITSKAFKYLGLLKRIFSSCYSIRAKKSLCNSCQITTNILFSTVESIPDQRYCYSRKDSEASY